MTVFEDKRKVWLFLMENMFKKDLIDELKGRRVLHWNYREYQQLPQELLVFGTLVEELYLKGNKLYTLPNWLSSLPYLCNLYLEGNGLRELPEGIGHCQLLDCLDIQNNQLTQLPETFSNLRNLTTLNLKGNCIQRFPKEFEKLKALAVLNVTSNGLQVLPECVCYLRSLQELILDKNELKHLPKQIVQLPNLHYLSVCKNQLEYLPLTIFVNHCNITFTHNPNLNYIQYELGCDLSRNSFVASNFDDDESWRLDITGCSVDNITDVNKHNIHVRVDGCKTVLKLPKEFRKIHQHANQTPVFNVSKLFELALRQSYEEIARINTLCKDETSNILHYISNIPSVGRLLNGGPTARCSNIECSEALFTEATLWVMRMEIVNYDELNRSMLSVLFFCSERCSRIYAEHHINECISRLAWSPLNSSF